VYCLFELQSALFPLILLTDMSVEHICTDSLLYEYVSRTHFTDSSLYEHMSVEHILLKFTLCTYVGRIHFTDSSLYEHMSVEHILLTVYFMNIC